MVVSIHQPHYLPWLGLLHKIGSSDVFISLDNVQYNKRSFQNRSLYSTQTGARYLSLAISSKGHQTEGLQIKDCQLTDPSEGQKHFKTLYHRYGKTPGWKLLAPEIEETLKPATYLPEIADRTLLLALKAFDINTKIVKASSLESRGQKSELMLSLTKAVGGNHYLSGTGAKDYMDDSLFEKSGVKVSYQAFKHPVYDQGISGSIDFQIGCFALEWWLLQPNTATKQFHDLIKG